MTTITTSFKTLFNALLAALVAAAPFATGALVAGFDAGAVMAAAALASLMCGGAIFASAYVRLHCSITPFVAPALVRRLAEGELGDQLSEISIVCADVRNYTSFSATLTPAQTLTFLREYYDAVGTAVAEHGGIIKDYAGDGVLILVDSEGDPAERAARAVALASRLRTLALAVTQSWAREEPALGVGIGVASGEVALGLVGGAQRTEFAAVGDAVNLSARLCSTAASGEILMDERTRTLSCHTGQSTRDLTLKGFAQPVAGYVIA